MRIHRIPFRLAKLSLCLIAVAETPAFAQMKISYGVPEGFSAVEMDNSATYVSTLNGKTLPGLVSYSVTHNRLEFDASKYTENGITVEEQNVIRRVLARIDYRQCQQGCDLSLDEYHVSIDKQRRTLSLRDSKNDYLQPETSWGLVNNQSLDLRGASDGYRAMNLSGSTWLGMPSQSFGYMNWYANRSEVRGYSRQDHDVSSYFLQKNFGSSYLRAGKQDSVDYASGAVSTLLTPSFDQFVTLGSQENLRSDRDVGSLVLYSAREGNYEFYRNGRLILKRPAILGRNEFSYLDMPGGYYPVEVRLVDRSGNVVNSEIRDINNLNFAGGGSNSWHITAGKDMYDGGRLLQASASRNMSQFYMNASAVSGDSRWATELNATRPSTIGSASLTPTIGLLSGERSTGGYVNLSMNDDVLGNLSFNRYQNTGVSRFYQGMPSTYVSYSRNLLGVTAGYNYQKRSRGEIQQAELRWNYRPNGLWSSFVLGLQKGGYSSLDQSDYSVYFNMTWTLDRNQASFRAARVGGQTQVSGDYRKEFQDSYGTSTAGMTVSRLDSKNSVNAYASRSGTRGDVSLNLGHDSDTSNADFNYRGMLAASSQGISLGRYSPGGSAMLLSTPAIGDTPYGFSVEGHPVAGDGTYAVPLGNYGDVAFARVLTNSEDMDMNIEVPANIIRAHPGQVYSADAKVDIHMVYSGLLVDPAGKPVGGRIVETGDTAYPNGLFSISSKSVLPGITVEKGQQRYRCDLSKTIDGSQSQYRCNE